MIDALCKIFASMIVRRVMAHVKKYLRREFFGFVQGVGTRELNFFLRRLMDWYLHHPTIHLFVHSLDFIKAFG